MGHCDLENLEMSGNLKEAQKVEECRQNNESRGKVMDFFFFFFLKLLKCRPSILHFIVFWAVRNTSYSLQFIAVY